MNTLTYHILNHTYFKSHSRKGIFVALKRNSLSLFHKPIQVLNNRLIKIGPNCSTLGYVCEIKIKSSVLGQFRVTQASLICKPYGLVCVTDLQTHCYYYLMFQRPCSNYFASEATCQTVLAYTPR